MIEFLFSFFFFIFIFVWISLNEERTIFIGIKQVVFRIFWFFIIFFLLGNFTLISLFEFFQNFFYANASLPPLIDFCNILITQQNVCSMSNYYTISDYLANSFYFSNYYAITVFPNYINYNNFLSTELVLSFFIACFCTISIFYILLLTRPVASIFSTYIYLVLLTIVSVVFIFTTSLFCIFVTFECLLLLSLGLLRLTSKSERIGEAISEMFIWTLFGSFFLLLGFFILYIEIGGSIDSYSNYLFLKQNLTSSLLCFFFLVGFGVKVPIWPFISWLLKAHVEASVEFSILLSGFIVKLGILGLWRILDIFSLNWVYLFILCVSCLAIFDATIRLFTQTDLKRIVALTTVIEMNWLNMCYLLGNNNFIFLSHFLIIAHCFTTSAEFLLVEFISKRYATRDFWQITGLWYNTPILWYLSFIIVLTTVGFPGTSIFFAKFLFFSILLSYSFLLFLYFIVIFFLLLPLFFIRLWVPIWFGLPITNRLLTTSVVIDLTSRELYLLLFTSGMGILLGIFPTFFLSIF